MEGDWVEWEAYLAGLTAPDHQRAEHLAALYGQETASRRVRYHLVRSLDELEGTLQRDSRRVRSRVPGLYESIDVLQEPANWTIRNDQQREHDGTVVVRTDVIGPNGATGFFERAFNADQQRIELRNAFLRLRGMKAIRYEAKPLSLLWPLFGW